MTTLTIGFVVGMRSEAALLPTAYPIACSGGIPAKARQIAGELLGAGASGLISFGIAGGLAPMLRPGDLVIGTGVVAGTRTIAADPAWLRQLIGRLPRAVSGLVYGDTDIAATPERKSQLHRETGALAVDLESGAVAEACQAAGKPFAVIRAVADPAGRRLPSLALDALDAEGRPLPMKVAAGLLRRPQELPGLIRVGLDSRAALSALNAAVGRLGPALGL
ncbi:nucleoside phosphorylase [Telmatospirillum siberiense]|uniref:Nucleoside phosphorylase n=1 Tax=Telmatospirillum siberiense TaxID=382514 RepID=A0A2N3PX60_9PROT|nr:nucleoside phosphorylase [Telmatospirillum siberiense]PKU24992.1 nucleoside phosphorylase [Telmatospirillum siberiense]